MNHAQAGPVDIDESSLLAPTIGGSVLVLGGLVAVSLLMANDPNTGPPGEKTEALRRFLEQHRRTVRMALSRGAGPLVSDMAASLGMSDEGPIGQALRSHRAELNAFLADDEVTLEEARGFAAALVRALGEQEALREPMNTLRSSLNVAL